LTATPRQYWLDGIVRAVQVIPSVEEAAADVKETVTKIPVEGLTVTANQFSLDGKVRWVHVIPLVDEAAMDEPAPTATKTPVVELQVTA
jgi:hypothetical protein